MDNFIGKHPPMLGNAGNGTPLGSGSSNVSCSSAAYNFQSERLRQSVATLSFYKTLGHGSGFSMQRGGSTAPGKKNQDPRSVGTDAFKKDAIRKVIQCLTWLNYPHPASPKMLSNPSRKDVLDLWTFLLGQIDPTIIIDSSNYTEDVPRIFKDLGYPFSISKSTVHAPNTGHSWPQILASLVWLCELLIYESAVFPGVFEIGAVSPDLATKQSWSTHQGLYENLQSKEDNNFTNPESALTRVVIDSYRMTMQGNDDREELANRIQSKFGDRTREICISINSKQQELNNLKNQSTAIMNELDASDELKRETEKRNEDAKKIESVNTALEDQTRTLEKEIAEKHFQLEEAAKEEKALNLKKDTLQKQIEMQGITREEVNRIHQEVLRKREHIDNAAKECEDLQGKNWELQMQLSNRIEALQIKAREVHNSIDKTVQSAKFPSLDQWGTIDTFKIDETADGSDSIDSLLGIPWKKTKSLLLYLKQTDLAYDNQMKESKIKLQQDCRNEVPFLREAHETQSAAEKLLESEEAQMKKEEDYLTNEIENYQSTIQELSSSVQRDKSQVRTDLLSVDKRKRELMSKSTSTKDHYSKEINKRRTHLSRVIKKYLETKEMIDNFLIKHKELSEGSLLQITLAANKFQTLAKRVLKENREIAGSIM